MSIPPEASSIELSIARSESSTAASPAAIEVWLTAPGAAAHFRPEHTSPAEQRRYTKLRSARRRQEFAASRALRAHVAVQANATLSHSGGIAALAHGPSGLRLGVDLQCHRPRDFLSLARFAFAAEEIDALERLQGTARERHFHQLWVMKEAVAKALGLTLFEALRSCIFTWEEGGWRGSIPHFGRDCDEWSVFLFEPRAQVSLALAIIGSAAPTPPSLHEWPPSVAAAWPLLACLTGAAADRDDATESRKIIDLESALPTPQMTGT